MESIMATINDGLRNKLQSLVSFLSQITRGFDAIAEEIDSTNLKTAMIALAVESKQYAKEIRDQLEHFNITIPPDDTGQVWEEIEEGIDKQAGSTRGGEIAELCNNCEMYFGKLYADVLQEHFLYKNLKDMITYQLYATECAFMKIRLLNAMRFN